MATITAEEIRGIRGKYGLSQRAFAGVLGIGAASIARYEQGAVPTKANANLIRAADNPQFMMECVEREGNALSEAARERVARVYYACVELPKDAEAAEADDAACHMNEVYDLTLRQEVLNEQAANLACDIMRYLINQNIDHRDKSNYASALLDKVFEVKNAIISVNIGEDELLDEISGFLKLASEIVKDINASLAVA